MDSEARRPAAERSGFVRPPQNLMGGLLLLALAALALWLTRDLPQGTLRSMGPAMLPRWLAIGVGLSGLALVVLSFLKPGDAMEPWGVRGPAFVLVAILVFAVTIRPFSFGTLTTPGLGLAAAGPLAIFIGGFATPEARIRELLVMAFALTAFCMVLFGDLLNLPIPMFPQSLADLFPAGWSNDGRLLSVAGILAAAALLIFLTGRSSRPSRTVDVADHSGRI